MRIEGYSTWSVCLSVSLRLFSHYRLRCCLRAIPTASVLQGHEIYHGDFPETSAFEGKQAKKPICIINTSLHRPGLARSAHRGRVKLLRGYVSKSRAALSPLTITQLACELRDRSRTALRDPAHKLAVRMRIIISNNNNYIRRPDTVRYTVLCH